MKIKILGTGCVKCHQLEKMTRQVVKELGIEAVVEEVKNINKIMEYPVLTTPGLVINEKLVSSGRVLDRVEITNFILEALDREEKTEK